MENITKEQPVPKNTNLTNTKDTNKTNKQLVDRLYRSETDRIIAGVAGGLGEYFNIDPALFRLAFVLITLAGGSGILVYLIMWLILPTESQIAEPGNKKVLEQNAQEVQRKAQKAGDEIKKTVKNEDAKLWWSIILIVAGFAFLFQNFGMLNLLRLSRFWPLILIILGAFILLKNDRK